MEEERPLIDAREALGSSESEMSPEYGGPQPRLSRLAMAGIVLVVSLLIAGLLLPPISLAQRLGLANAAEESRDPSASAVLEGVRVRLAGSDADVALEVVPAAGLAENEATEGMAAALPAGSELAGDVYLVTYDEDAPQGTIQLPLPEGTEPVDLMGWDGATWTFIPVAKDANGETLTSALVNIPDAFALMALGAPDPVSVGAEVLPTQELPAPVLPLLSELTAGTLTLGEAGELLGEAVEVADGGYQQLLRVTNVGAIVDEVTLAALLADQDLVDAHIDALLAAAGAYDGLNLDYQGVAPGQQDDFSAFVADLAAALHANDQTLVVTLDTPVLVDSGEWETDGQDWQALGATADAVYVQLPLNPLAYSENGPAQELLEWAVTQVHRHKLTLLASANAVDTVGSSYRELPNVRALENFGELALTEGSETVEVGSPVEVALAGVASALEWDTESMMYRYNYEQAGQPHTVWLNNEAALSHRLRFAASHNVRGIAIRGLGGVTNGEGFAQTIESYVSAATPPEPAGAAIVWTVEDDDESVVASSSGDALTFRWEETGNPGDYLINAAFAQGDAVAQLGSLAIAVVEPEEPEPTPEPQEDAQALLEEEDEEEEEETIEPTPTPGVVLDPGASDAVVNIATNFREGPGLGYAVIEVLASGTKLSLIGRSSASDWLQVRLVDNPEKEGWLFASLVSVNDSFAVSGLPVVAVDPPAGGGGNIPPPPPVANGNFELGGQTHHLGNPTLMQQAGMSWVKFQHKWGPGDSPSAVADRINHAHGNGFKVLLSIPGAAAYPNSIDFAAYVDFLRGVAALGPDAIEIWNEMNIDFEWPAGQINPTSYVNEMLAPAYQAIKGANASVMVVSGAPAPTGFDNGTNAWADDRYMAGVAAAGGANHMDCIGVHHNAGATPPSATSGHPAGNNHYSWYFGPTLNMYYNAFGGARPVCFTELGYLSGEDFGGVPSRFSWAANTTVAQHAQWLGEATSLAGNSGKVRMLIVFNVDFTHWGDDPQAGYAILRPNGSCPACSTLRAAMGQ